MEIQNEPATPPVAAGSAPKAVRPERGGFDALTSEDFLTLVITQLQNQDPLQPASNEELMQQFATIREIEMSVSITDTIRSLADQQSSVTDTMKALAGQQRFSAASSLIGKYVRGSGPDPETGAPAVEGFVQAVRFNPGGEAVLELTGGRALPIAKVVEVAELAHLVGQTAEFLERDGQGALRHRVGIISGAAVENGEPILTLDVGELFPKRVSLRDVVSIEPSPEEGSDESGTPSES